MSLPVLAKKVIDRSSQYATTRSTIGRKVYELTHSRREVFHCPICGYRGPFRDNKTPDTSMHDSLCTKCYCQERHRLSYLVMSQLGLKVSFDTMSMLHFAPERQHLSPVFREWFGNYETADYNAPEVDHRNTDLRDLTFGDATYDFVFLSHVLEHIDDDVQAITEISRILKPGGIALVAVPMAATETLEYGEPFEYGHWRCPGPDYYGKLDPFFDRVELHRSDDYPAAHQLYVHEDRTSWPSADRPMARPMEGDSHEDVVAVAYKAD